MYSESYTRGRVIPNEMGSARCRATPALDQSANETRTPASRCLPVMPLPRLVTLVPRQRVQTTPPLELGDLTGSVKGWPERAGYGNQVDRLSRVLGHRWEVEWGAW